MAEPKFVDGLRVSRRENAPKFVIANLGIKVDEFKNWLIKNQEGIWMNIDIKLSKKGTMYAELNTYRKEDHRNVRDEVEDNQRGLSHVGAHIQYPDEEAEINTEDIPF